MLQKIIHFSINNKLVIGLATLLLVIWGAWSATHLKVDALPDITNNQVQIITRCPSLASIETEQLVSYPIEQVLSNLPDVEEIRSISRFGLSVVTIVFKDKVEIYFARQLINEKLVAIFDKLPQGIEKPELAPVSTGLGEIYQYVLHPKKGSEQKYNAMDLRTMQEWIVARQLYGIEGVAEINSFGGFVKQYEVAVVPEQLKAYGVTLPEIFAALQNNNENTGGSYIEKKERVYYIRGVGVLETIEDIGNVIIKNNGTPILIKNVAKVQLGHAVRYGALTYNGQQESVGGIVMMLKGHNSFDVVTRVKERIKNIQSSLPNDVVIEPYLDRTDLVKRALSTVEKNLVEGALIVIFVLILFLGNLRAGLIVSSAIPLAMLFALGMMNFFDVSANLMSLGAIDFGLIVDGSVIIVEASLHFLQHHLKQKNEASHYTQEQMNNAVETSTNKMMKSALFGQIIIIIVYIPILSLRGIEGKMFIPMAQTVTFALIGAMLLSLTYIPMISSLFLSKKVSTTISWSERMMNLLNRGYTALLEKCLQVKKVIISAVVLLFAASVMLFGRMGSEFIPVLQEGDYLFDFVLPQGTSLSQTVKTSLIGQRMINKFPEVELTVGKTGSAELATDPMPLEGTDFMIKLKPKSEWTTADDYMELADTMIKTLQQIPGASVEFNQPIQMKFNDLISGVKQDIAVKIFGENMDTLLHYAEKVSTQITDIQGAKPPIIERVSGLPQITIDYDRALMAQYGVDVNTINNIVRTSFGGEVAGTIKEQDRIFDLVVRLDETMRNDIDQVSNLLIPVGDRSIPLNQIATVKLSTGPSQISREAGKRRIVVGFNLKDRDIKSAVDELKVKLNKNVPLPVGYFYEYGGTFENLEKATARLNVAIPIALLLIFLLLFATFKSAKQGALIFSTIPMSAIGGIVALYLRDMPFSISAGIGFIALFGVAVLNGIVLVSTFNDLKKEGKTNIKDIIIEGCQTRLRPVLMTAAVASLGFIPMAISTGSGAEVQKPLATVVIGGLMTATILTLFILPLLYYWVYNREAKNSVSKKALATVLMLFVSLGLSAQNKTISLENALQKAQANNRTIRSSAYDLEKKKLQQNTTLPTSNLGPFIENEDLQPGNNTGILKMGVNFSQPWPWQNKLRKELGKAEYDLQNTTHLIQLQKVKKDIRDAYNNAAYLLRKKEMLQELLKAYKTQLTQSELRVRVGESAKLESMSASLRKKEVEMELKNLDNDILLANRNLSLLIGENILYQADANDFEQYNFIDLNANAETLPLLLQYDKSKNILNNQLALDKIAKRPQLNSRFFSQRLYGVQNPYTGFSVGINFPIGGNFYQQQKEITQVSMAQLDANQQAQEREIQANENTLQQVIIKQKELVNYYKNTALPASQEINKAVILAYKSGEMSYVDYLQYFIENVNIQKKQVETIYQYNQSAIQLLFYKNL